MLLLSRYTLYHQGTVQRDVFRHQSSLSSCRGHAYNTEVMQQCRGHATMQRSCRGHVEVMHTMQKKRKGRFPSECERRMFEKTRRHHFQTNQTINHSIRPGKWFEWRILIDDNHAYLETDLWDPACTQIVVTWLLFSLVAYCTYVGKGLLTVLGLFFFIFLDASSHLFIRVCS